MQIKKPPTWITLGGLGPDLDRENVVRSRANRLKVSDFSCQLRDVNMSKVYRPHSVQLGDQVVKQLTARDRAKEYALSITQTKPQMQIRPQPRLPLVTSVPIRDRLMSLLREHRGSDRAIRLIRLRYTARA